MNFLRTVSKRSFLFTLTVLFMVSCAKDIDIFTPNAPMGNIESFFEKVQSETLNQVIDAEITDTIITDNQSLIIIPDHAFVHLNGSEVVGDIEMEYIEILDKSLMMLYKTPTVSDDKLLESDAVYYLNAKKDGEQLELAQGKKILFQVPDQDEEPDNLMQLFYGEEVDNLFNWKLGDPEQGWDEITIDDWEWQDNQETIVGYGYEFEINELNWIGVNKFKDVPSDEKTQVCIELPELYDNTNTIIYMAFTDLNSVGGFVGDPEQKVFCEPYGLTPTGSNVTFVVISEQGDGIYHFGTKVAVIQEDHGEFIVPQPKSLDEILDIISQF